MDVHIEPKEAVTGFLSLPGAQKIRLDFLITYESDAYYIRCLDFGIMSCGDTIGECKENVKEAILIYLEDLLPEQQNLFKPATAQYWQMFYELRYQSETKGKAISGKERQAIRHILRSTNHLALQYA